MVEVLIVDNSAVVRKTVRRALERMALRIREGANGSQALATCSLAMPDAILIDGDMPEIDACDLAKRIRRLPGSTATRMVVSFSENDPPRLARAIYSGFNDFILKPFDAELLRSKFSF